MIENEIGEGMLLLAAIFILSFIVTALTIPLIIKFCTEKKIGGNDVHKKGKPFVPGLGGISIILGIISSLFLSYLVLSSSDLSSYFDSFTSQMLSNVMLFSILIILITAIVGLIDDFISIPHKWKFLFPLIISIPIIFLKLSWLHIPYLPLVGPIPIPMEIYLFILVPIGVMAVTNLTNTFAGYNGLEAGLAAVISFFFLLIGISHNLPIVILLSIPLLSSSIAFLFFNWYPAKIFIDDVGTLTIGAIFSEIIILGGLEFVGFILLLLHIIDFLFFKIPNKLPSKNWWGTLKNGKLYHTGKSIHLGQFILSRFNGLKEEKLVLFFLSIEVLLGLIAFLISFI